MSGESKVERRRLEDEELRRQCDGLVAVGEWLTEVGPGLLKRSQKREIIDGYPRATRLGGGGHTKGSHSDPTEAAARLLLEGKFGVDPIGDAAKVIRQVVPGVIDQLRDLEKVVSYALPPTEWLVCTCPLEGERRQVITTEGTCLRCGWAIVANIKERNEVLWCASHLRFGKYVVADGRRGRCNWCYRWQLDKGTFDDPPEWELRQHDMRVPRHVETSAR